MLRYLTAGESHGSALTGILEGLPAHVRISTADLIAALARRRLGHGRGARMGFEQDQVTILGGVRHGETLGSPIAVTIANTEWPKWERIMSADEVDPTSLDSARNAPLTRPRPGHADLAGMQKYDFAEARPILERASARETATRVALGEFAKHFLSQALGVEILSHVTAIGGVVADPSLPTPADVAVIDADPVRCFDSIASTRMVERIDQAQKNGDTLGGIIEVLVYGCPPGVGTHVSSDKRLDARLAAALMGIQAIKGVEVGDGFALAASPGSAAHDPMEMRDGSIARLTNHAGGIEGGMSNGSVIRLRAAMKPIATVPHALPTVDVATGSNAPAHHQRSDVCAVPAAGVIAEAMVALALTDAVLDMFGGDTVSDIRIRVEAYHARIREAGIAMGETGVA